MLWAFIIIPSPVPHLPQRQLVLTLSITIEIRRWVREFELSIHFSKVICLLAPIWAFSMACILFILCLACRLFVITQLPGVTMPPVLNSCVHTSSDIGIINLSVLEIHFES